MSRVGTRRVLLLIITFCSAPMALPQEFFGIMKLNSENVWPVFVSAIVFGSVVYYVTTELKSSASRITSEL